MSTTVNLDRAELAQAELAREGIDPGPPLGTVDELKAGRGSIDPKIKANPEVEISGGGFYGAGSSSDSPPAYNEDEELPTEEELRTLRRVSGRINWAAYSVAICEMAERFSYYGASILYTNFVVHGLPDGSNTGAGHGHSPAVSGALGLGSKAGQGISLTNTFFAYLMPLFG